MKYPAWRQPRTLGLLCLLLGAVLFSTKAVLIKLAYTYEVSSISLLGLRMIFSLPLFLLIGYFRGKQSHVEDGRFSRRYLYVIGLGVLGYYLASYLDFLGLQYLTAGMERVILFTYPTVVLLLERLIFGTRIRRVQWLATGLCYLGILIAFSGSDLSQGTQFLRGAGLVFLGGVCYAGYVIGSGRLAPRMGTARFTSLALTTAACAVIVHVSLSDQPLLGLHRMVYTYAAIMALFSTVIPSYLMTAGIQRLGAGDAAIVGAIGPVATVVLEYYLLGETMTLMQAGGAAIIVLGVVMIGTSKG